MSTIEIEPGTVPAAVGAKLARIVQLSPGARTELGHPLNCENPAPNAVMLVMERLALPVFVNMTFCRALVVPTSVLKVRLLGLNVIPGPLVEVTEIVA